MTTQNKTAEFEKVFYNDLHQYLVSINCIDDHFPEAPDIEACWAKIGESYMPDGLREFNKYPIVSLGWPMFIGMAIAKYWDEDWALYSKVEDLYHYLRERIDFDHMDDYVCDKVLLLDANAKKKLQEIVGECASRTLNKLLHLGVAPGARKRSGLYRCLARALSHGSRHAAQDYGVSHDKDGISNTLKIGRYEEASISDRCQQRHWI